MIGYIFGIFCIISFLFANINGDVSSVSNAVIKGCESTIKLCLSLAGMMCFWSGIMALLKAAGAIGFLSKLLSPLLRFAFPDAYKKKTGLDEISASVSANALGLSNAATPLALSAMDKLNQINANGVTASDDMITFVAMSTAPLCIFPTTILSIRTAAGCCDPFAVVLPIWICSFCCFLFSILISRFFCKTGKILSPAESNKNNAVKQGKKLMIK